MHKVIPSRFVIAENRTHLKDAGYIIELVDPFYIGRILVFKDQSEYLTNLTQSLWPVAEIPGYMILVQYAGTVPDELRLKVSAETHGQIENTVKSMAEFFYYEKIQRHLGFYKKYYIRTISDNYKKRF